MRLTTFFKVYNICILLHRCNLKILVKNQFDKNYKIYDICKIFADFSRKLLIFQTDFLRNFEIAAVQKDANLVELEKCCQTHIFLQNFVLIQPRTSPLKICKIC